MERSGEESLAHRRKRKPKIGLILALGITLLIADALLLAFLLVPGVSDRASAAFDKPPTEEELRLAHEERLYALRTVLPRLSTRVMTGAQRATDFYLAQQSSYEPHSRFNVSNFDFDRYRADHPEIASPDDEDFIVYVSMVKNGIPADTEIHATDEGIEQILNGGDQAARTELLQELSASFYQGSTIPGWESAVYTPEEEQAILDFYAGSVFAGDSVMLGFSYHCAGHEDPFFANMRFLAAGSYSIREAILEDGEFHPPFRGQNIPLWESLPQIGAQRVFLFFGVNDMAITPEATKKYEQLIARIEEAQPGIEIGILSATHPFKQGARLNGDNITAFNEIMRYKAAENGWDYVDVATPLSDGQGRLQERYCSDGDLHMTWSAYDVWGQLLHAYAYTEIYGEMPPERVQETESAEEGAQPAEEEKTQAPADDGDNE